MRPTSSRSLCLPPARAHFCELTARWYGGASSPTKYGLNGTMPATVNSTVGSCGIRLADGTTVWSACREEVGERGTELVGGARRGTHCLAMLPRSVPRPFARGSRAGGTARRPRLDVHEWISFDDRRAADVGVRRHVPALLWTCIFGAGCKGVLDGRRHRAGRRAAAATAHTSSTTTTCADGRGGGRPLTPEQWQFQPQGAASGGFLDPTTAPRHPPGRRGVHLPQPSRLRRGPGCALHVAALEPASGRSTGSPTCAGSCRCGCTAHRRPRPRHVHPARVEAARLGRGWRRVPLVVHRVGRRLRRHDAVYEYLRDEIVEMVGEPVYERLVALLQRPRWTPLPHPAVRR